MSKNRLSRSARLCGLAIGWLLVSGCEEPPLMALGQLESERVELVAEFAEPLRNIYVTEGDEIIAEQPLVELDSERVDLLLAEADANIAAIQTLLEEQINGPRREVIDAMSARVQSAEVDMAYAQQEYQRLMGLRSRDLTSRESLDQAKKAVDSARAQLAISQAQLAELLAGTRSEQIARTREQLKQARSQRELHARNKSRHTLAGAEAGIVDSLPFEIGEIPKQGDVIAVVLTGTQPLARVYIPEPQRVRLAVGDSLEVRVDGLAMSLRGTVKRISSEPSFTPYFALNERDRSRLSYVAEIEIQYTGRRLPDGVPVQVPFDDTGT